MARQKGKSEKPSIATRTKKLREKFKRTRALVETTSNEKDYATFLAYCEKRLNTFDPQHTTYTDYEAKREAANAPPKRFGVLQRVPLQVVEVVPPQKKKSEVLVVATEKKKTTAAVKK
jgi:hypothetical protein